MKKNMGSIDQLFRLLVAVIIGILYYRGDIDGNWAIFLSIIGLVFLLTSMVGYCPIYTILRINTCGIKKIKP